MPATEASEAPIAQLSVDSRAGRPPKVPMSARLSTTPRMAMPVRVRERKSRSPTAMAMAAPTVTTSSQSTFTPRTVKPSNPKNWGTTRAVGFQR